MKPHEERWTASVEEFAGYDCMTDATVVRTDNGSRVCDFTADDPRARLAAQSPAMARLLLFRMGDRHCQYCGTKVDRVTETGIQDPVYRGETLTLSNPGNHMKDCALVAVLRAAGAIE